MTIIGNRTTFVFALSHYCCIFTDWYSLHWKHRNDYSYTICAYMPTLHAWCAQIGPVAKRCLSEPHSPHAQPHGTTPIMPVSSLHAHTHTERDIQTRFYIYVDNSLWLLKARQSSWYYFQTFHPNSCLLLTCTLTTVWSSVEEVSTLVSIKMPCFQQLWNSASRNVSFTYEFSSS